MGIETALQEAGEKGITVFEYFWDKYPAYVILILLGFAIMLILACLPRKVTVVHTRYYPQQQVQQLPQQPLPPREVVIHHEPVQRI